MEGGGVYNDSRMANILLKGEKIPCCSSKILDSPLLVPKSSSPFHVSASMVNLEDENDTERPFFTQADNKMGNYNVDFDNCYHRPGRKGRLMTDQVRFLEKSFEVDNKLEPERKNQLAKELALQPRQVAIWFQNRRARCKTKVLEKEYDDLKASYDKLKADYDNLCERNENMENEVKFLREKLLQKEKENANAGLSDPIISPKDSQSKKPIFSPNVDLIVPCKQEDAPSSAKSDIFDSESPHCNNDHHVAALDNSSHVFEPEASDFSEDEDDDNMTKSLLTSSIFPKNEDAFCDDLQPNSCNLGYPVQDHGTWFWRY